MSGKFETQQRLLAATRSLIVEQGMEACTLENICQRAGFSRGAFYSNFGTKDSLLAAMTEDEYGLLIDALQAKVAQWSAPSEAGTPCEAGAPCEAVTPSDSTGTPGEARIEDLLPEAIAALGFDESLFILHSEMMMRSIRNPKWGARLFAINNEFIEALASVLELILEKSGRELTFDRRALTHAVIGVVTRAAGVDAWRRKVSAATTPGNTNGPFTASSTKEILDGVLLLLYGASVPRR